MLDALATTAWKRPWALLGATAALIAVLGAVALAGMRSLGPGSTHLTSSGEPDVVLAARTTEPLAPRVTEVALETVAANLEADPAVAAVAIKRSGKASGKAWIEVDVAGSDSSEERDAVERFREEIDPGPLEVFVGGETAELLDAADGTLDDVWRVGLLALPLIALVLIGAVGIRRAAAPLLSAALAVAAGLAGLGLAGVVADVSFIAALPTVAVGVVLGLELPVLLLARYGDEPRDDGPAQAIRHAIEEGAGPLAFAALVAVLASGALLATGLQFAGSIVIGVAFSAAGALAAALALVPAVVALGEGSGAEEVDPVEGRVARVLGAVPRGLARGPIRLAAAIVLVAGALLVLASGSINGHSGRVGDLPEGSESSQAAKIVPARVLGPDLRGSDVDDDSLYPELPLAAVLATALLGAAFLVRSRSPGAGGAALMALLPAAAVAAVLSFVFEYGDVDPFGWRVVGTVDTAALAGAIGAIVAISAGRSAIALDVVRRERELDPGPAGVAERSGVLSLPATLWGTLVAGGLAAGVAGEAVGTARAFGLGIAAGLLLDLVLIRPLTLAILARWEGASPRRRLRWPRWPKRLRRRAARADSAS